MVAAIVACAFLGLTREPTVGRRWVLTASAAAAVAPRAAPATVCDPTTGEECMGGNFWQTGKFTYSKEAQLAELANSGDADRTVLRLVARLQRQRQAFADLGAVVALGEADDARRRLRQPPLDDVRKSTSELAGLQADTRRARAEQRKFTQSLDVLDTQLMRVTRRERSAEGLAADYDSARRQFDKFLVLVGVPPAERAE